MIKPRTKWKTANMRAPLFAVHTIFIVAINRREKIANRRCGTKELKNENLHDYRDKWPGKNELNFNPSPAGDRLVRAKAPREKEREALWVANWRSSHCQTRTLLIVDSSGFPIKLLGYVDESKHTNASFTMRNLDFLTFVLQSQYTFEYTMRNDIRFCQGAIFELAHTCSDRFVCSTYVLS